MIQRVYYAIEDLETDGFLFKAGDLYDDRIESIGNQMLEDGAYKFKALENRNGRLTRIKDIISVAEPSPIPKLVDIEPFSLDELEEKGGEVEVIKGLVGRIINSRETGNAIGMEIGDLNSLFTATVWFEGRFDPISEEQKVINAELKRGDAVTVHGSIYVSGTNVSMTEFRIVKG